MSKRNPVWAALSVMLFLAVTTYCSSCTQKKNSRLSYSELLEKIKSKPKAVKSIAIANAHSEVKVIMKYQGKEKPFTVNVPNYSKEKLLEVVDRAGIPVIAEAEDRSAVWFSIKLSPSGNKNSD